MPGDGWLSDESSFYGQTNVAQHSFTRADVVEGGEGEQERLQMPVDHLTEEIFWKLRNKDPNCIAQTQQKNEPQRLTRRARAMSGSDLHNVYQGKPDAWQLGESVGDFLRRLPPLSTPKSFCPWIWVANPHPDGRDRSRRSHVSSEFIPRGKQLLQQALVERENIRRANAQEPRGKVNRLLNQESESLNRRITQPAEEKNVLSGKWMLFPKPSELADTWWMTVAEGTINNRLGSAAKVATSGEPVICIYTKDFRDVDDVRRVLGELAAMGLVSPGRAIAYKPDAYTYLDIYKENAEKYGLRASLYTSFKLLP